MIGGLAVNAHGVIRSTKDVDIVPAGDQGNLARLADLLSELEVRQLGVGDGGFSESEMPLDPTKPDDLSQGGNFRLDTPMGVLDVNGPRTCKTSTPSPTRTRTERCLRLTATEDPATPHLAL